VNQCSFRLHSLKLHQVGSTSVDRLWAKYGNNSQQQFVDIINKHSHRHPDGSRQCPDGSRRLLVRPSQRAHTETIKDVVCCFTLVTADDLPLISHLSRVTRHLQFTPSSHGHLLHSSATRSRLRVK